MIRISSPLPGSLALLYCQRQSYAGPVIRVKQIGSYWALGRTHDKIATYLAALGIERNGDTWESYVSDAKREDTKHRRIEKILPMISKGAGLHDKYH